MTTSLLPMPKPALRRLRQFVARALCAATLTTGASAEAWEDPCYESGSVKLTLSATWRQLWGYRSDKAAWLGLTLPLERFAAPHIAAAPVATEPDSANSAESEKPPDAAPREPKSSQPPKPPAPAEPSRPRRKKSPAPLFQLSSHLARLTVRAALRTAGRSSAERWLDGLDTRSRTSSLLPELRLRGGRSVAESLRLSPTVSDPYRFVQAGGTDLFFDAQVTWNLDRLVFANEELAVERLRQQRAAADAALVRRVLEALFAWQRAVAECANPEISDDERSACTLRALEATVTLDVLTGGWFTESGTGGRARP